MSSAAKIKEVHQKFEQIKKEIGKVIIGQEDVIEQILIAILTDSNALLESYPGLGKTTMIKTLAQVLDLDFARIQSTPDLMPSDITGTYIIEESHGKKSFKFQKGPIFANIILADEINRATPKTQAALLEAMQEKQVTVGNQTFALDRPFFVLATQNPIDQEGTYPLPEAQTDRFLLKILVEYPKLQEELSIVEQYSAVLKNAQVHKMLKKETLIALQKLTRQVLVSDDIKKAVVQLVARTREYKDAIEFGASPRASIGLILAAKARALLHGRSYVSGEDVKVMALPVLRHRILLSFKAVRAGKTPDDVIRELIK
ncbi:MoxR family ATPase [Candidatus Woesearchaeota archaeon]|nr:MAG: MoxR family ATPase [Candidatus Woesearchaeota archaeon]